MSTSTSSTTPRKSPRLDGEGDGAAWDSVVVRLPHGRTCPIVFAEVSKLGEALAANGLASTGKRRAALVSNSLVGKLKHRAEAEEALRAGGWDVVYVEIPDGEAFKTAETYVQLVDDLLGKAKIDRKSLVVGLGGGVTTDIVGFAAATALRGVNFVNVPTTLLAMVDASVGGKTGVNTKHGKNLLGAFWQPSLVLASVDALKTLPLDEYNCGMGEVVKHAVLEESGEFFTWLEKHAEDLARGPVQASRDALTYAVKRCCEIKGAVVGEDEREDGKRALLNLGHTVGHAIEHVMGFGNVPHGVAVAIGTVAEARLAEMRGECDEPGLARRIAKLLNALHLPYSLELKAPATVPALLDAVFMDKKRDGAMITITVPRKVGDVRLVKVKPEELERAFQSLGDSKSLLAAEASL